MRKITKEDFIKKYGNIKVNFSRYYKYSFYFVGKHEDKTIIVTFGGCAEDIYRFEVGCEDTYYISEVDWYSGGVYDKDWVELEEIQ